MKNPIIKIKNLTKIYKNGFKANDDISFEIQAGQFFGVLGVNGAGKSTLLNTISNLILPTSGSIEICGTDLLDNPTLAKQFLGVVPQEVNLSQFETMEEILTDYVGLYGITDKSTKEYIDYLLENLILNEHKHKRVSALSGGMRRRLLIARALVNKPKILLLDEPTAGVDVEIRHSLWEFIKKINQNGTTVILTTHYLEEAEKLCDQIAIIHGGKVIKNDTTANLISTLQTETISIKIEKNIEHIKRLTLPTGVEITNIDLENKEVLLKIPSKINYNTIFEALTKEDIFISDFRHLENRLENMFLSLVKN